MSTHLSPMQPQKTDPTSPTGTARIGLTDKPRTRSAYRADGKLIPFLLHSAEQSWITHDLCKLLTRRNHSSILCHVDEQASTTEAEVFEHLARQGASGYEYHLLPVTSPQLIKRLRLSHVVLLIPANLDAICLAYQRIKLLAEETTPEIGIVMVGPRDQHAAWRYFRKLAVGTLRYLDIPLLNLGFLPDQITPQCGPADHHRDNFLTRISERLLRSEFHTGNLEVYRKSG